MRFFKRRPDVDKRDFALAGLDSNDPAVRMEAAKALAALADPTTLEAVQAAISREQARIAAFPKPDGNPASPEALDAMRRAREPIIHAIGAVPDGKAHVEDLWAIVNERPSGSYEYEQRHGLIAAAALRALTPALTRRDVGRVEPYLSHWSQDVRDAARAAMQSVAPRNLNEILAEGEVRRRETLLLTDADAASTALADTGSDAARDALLRALVFGYSTSKKAAARGLAAYFGSEVIDWLRDAASEAEFHWGTGRTYLGLTHTASPQVRRSAGDVLLPFLLDALRDNAADTREKAASMLGLLRDERAVNALLKALKDTAVRSDYGATDNEPGPQWYPVRIAAARALAAIGEERSLAVVADFRKRGLDTPRR